MRFALEPERPATEVERGLFESEAAACRQELYRYAIRLTGSGMDADDLVQETLLRALRSWRSFRPGTRMLSWLRTILYHEFVDEYRSRKRLEDLLPQADSEAPSHLRRHEGAQPLGFPNDNDLTDTVEQALHCLSPEHRDVVQLSDLEGFSGDETAAVLGVPAGTVKSRLFRARRLLRGSLMATARELGYGMAVAQ